MTERWWRVLVFAWAAMHLRTLFGELPEPDAALYASIARRMAETGNWVDLIAYNVDWLDKPHFPFWAMAASFKVFGVHTWSARLPALACFFLGVWATWKLARELFSPWVAQVSVIIVLSAQHLLMSNADTRAEPWLVGLLTTAVWLTVRVARAERAWVRDLVLASAFTALAMMTKGPFVLIPVASVAVLPALLRREPVRWGRWLLAVGVVCLFLTPELVCLDHQFDAHPEKVIFDRTGVSGVRWFLWESQLGRFTNSGPIRGRGDPAFFLHTVLWAFLPWAFLLYAAGLARLRKTLSLRQRGEVARSAGEGRSSLSPPLTPALSPLPQGEGELWAASLPLVLVFSASRFQLPHYLNVVYPFFGIALAAWLEPHRDSRTPRLTQRLVVVGMTGFMAWLVVTFDGPNAALVAGALVLGVSLVLRKVRDVVVLSALAALLVNVVHQNVYIPQSLRYQSGGAAAELANSLPPMRTAMIDLSSHAFAFHLNERAEWWTDQNLREALPAGPVRVLIREQHLTELGVPARVLGRFEYFPASRPTAAFLDAKRRPTVLDTWVLAECSPP